MYIPSNKIQKYYCIPFVRENDNFNRFRTDGTVRKGWFMIHFDGEKPVRQIELHPGRSPLLLLAGLKLYSSIYEFTVNFN